MKRVMRAVRDSLQIDTLLLVITLALLAFGLLMLYSATFYVGVDFWYRQLLWVLVGGIGMAAMIFMPYTIWKTLATPLMGITLVLLILALLVGKPVLGAQRAIMIFGISVQPGVLARLTTVIYIATWLASKGQHLEEVRYGLVPFAVITGIVGGVVLLQPDLSTVMLLVVTALMMFFFAGGDPAQIFLFTLVGGTTLSVLGWQWEHARQRILSYVAALRDPAERSYHGYRALLAISEGGIFGQGVGNGRLKAGYLPFSHTDSIFAVVGEELGLLGTLLVLGLFTLLAYRGYRVALETPDPFGSLLAFGVTTMIIGEVFLNVMVMIGLIPFTGTALPFFSYGGSEMVVTLAGAGLLLGISRGRPKGEWDAILDRWWRDGWTRLSGSRRRQRAAHR
jgi:cell division protein FtsW